MKNKEFYLIDAKNVTKGIDFIKEDNIIKFTSRKCLCDTFNSYGLPGDAQVIIIEKYPYKLGLMNSNAKEFITDYHFHVTNENNNVCGYGTNDFEMIKFKSSIAKKCTYEEVLDFLKKLKRKNILENYVYAVEEAFRKDYIIDEKLENIKLLIK